MQLDEASVGSRLAHPNIVTLYDAGEEEGSPYLVFEYVPGQSLSAAIREHKGLQARRAVDVAIGVLRGLACAHGKRVLHRDPALGSTITRVNMIICSDSEPISVLCDGILKDLAIASKLLKIVNTAYYSQFGGSNSTISRAVAILGVNGVREVAMSLLLYEHLENKAQAAKMKDEIAATYFSGMLARELSRNLGNRAS